MEMEKENERAAVMLLFHFLTWTFDTASGDYPAKYLFLISFTGISFPVQILKASAP